MQADFDVQDFENRTKSDPKAFVRFFIMPVKDEKASIEAGRPIFKEEEMCEILVPGSQSNRPVKRVNSIVKQRFSQQYASWKATGNSEEYLSGTHLAEVPWITRSQVEELAYFRIRTLEQLASVNDNACSRMTGLFNLRAKAKEYLARAEADAPFEKLQAQIDELKAQIQVKDQTIAELAERIEEE
jgi:hypothetical protein